MDGIDHLMIDKCASQRIHNGLVGRGDALPADQPPALCLLRSRFYLLFLHIMDIFV
jgi:hypothetical protein